MRNILALVAAFTLSSSAATAVACGNESGTTTKVFNWNQIINGKTGWTSEDLLKFLLDNTNNGIGQSLYKDVVDYVSLSILKTDATFASDRAFADITVTNQLENEKDSLKNKYGRSWEKKWKEILKDPSNGGDGKTGSYSRYFDSKLKSLAANIVTQHYVTNNYNNFKYYEQSRIQLWLQDLFVNVKKGPDIEVNINKYINDPASAYGKYVWIIAKANNPQFDPVKPVYKLLADDISKASSFAYVPVSNQVPQTPNDDPKSDNYIVDTNSSNSIKGLLSAQQANIARLWMKNQGPLWTRQIVVKFDDTVKDPLTKPITSDQFKSSIRNIEDILNNINKYGFTFALDKVSNHSIAKVSSSADTGDLGLSLTLNAESSKIDPAFSYYVDRYVTSTQGINSSAISPFNLAQFNLESSDVDVKNLIATVDHQLNDGANVETGSTVKVLKQSSQFRDEVFMIDNDKTTEGSEGAHLFSGDKQNKVAIFIDKDGLHFVQTPGIVYKAQESTDSTQVAITKFSGYLNNKDTISWEQTENVVNRPGGLSSNSYLAYLQTQFLRSKSNDSATGVYFDLNDSLKTFVSDTSPSLNSKNWWDYVLYFNNNIEKINWNIDSSDKLSQLLNQSINAESDAVSEFTKTLETWFIKTNRQRWNSLQGISSTDKLKNNINIWNDNLDKNTGQTVTPARLDSEDLISYLTNVAYNTIWWYDPNSIKN